MKKSPDYERERYYSNVDYEKLKESLCKQLSHYFKTQKYNGKRPFKKALIGLSGGVDSSVTAYLAAEALGPDKMFAIIMPKGIFRLERERRLDRKYGIMVAEELGIKYMTFPIRGIYVNFLASGLFKDFIARATLQTRIRMCLLYGAAKTYTGLVLGTATKTELKLAYVGRYGDAGYDLGVTGELYKTELFDLAQHLEVPAQIVDREASAGIFWGQTDTTELFPKLGGVKSHEEIDVILQDIFKENNYPAFEEKKRSIEDYNRKRAIILDHHTRLKYKVEPAPLLKAEDLIQNMKRKYS